MSTPKDTSWSPISGETTSYTPISSEDTSFSQVGGPTSSTLSSVTFDMSSVNFDEGECLFDGPVRTTVFSAQKKTTTWTQ